MSYILENCFIVILNYLLWSYSNNNNVHICLHTFGLYAKRLLHLFAKWKKVLYQKYTLQSSLCVYIYVHVCVYIFIDYIYIKTLRLIFNY